MPMLSSGPIGTFMVISGPYWQREEKRLNSSSEKIWRNWMVYSRAALYWNIIAAGNGNGASFFLHEK